MSLLTPPTPSPVTCLVSDLPASSYASLVAHARAALESPAVSSTTPACDAALTVKRAMEAETGELWHVIIGSAFGASVSHEAGCCASFRLGGTSVLAWSSLDEATLVRGKRVRAGAALPGGAVVAEAGVVPEAAGGAEA